MRRWVCALLAGVVLLSGCGAGVISTVGETRDTGDPKYVALTFDDGPSPRCTPRLLDGLRELLGEGEYWVRPPYGLMTEAEAAALSVPLVNWSVDTEDWRTKDSGKILDVIYRCTGDGDIVLLHDRYQNTVDAVLMAIEHLQQQGYVFVTVAELLEIKGIAPQAGETYRRAK